MGEQYNLRIQMDKEKREYYNKEVKELLGMTESHKGDPKESVLHILRTAPWTTVPMPTTPLPTQEATRTCTPARTRSQAGTALGGESNTVSRLLRSASNSNSSNSKNSSTAGSG